ncbi:helix-turn-helix domain-containing protein [uncultured Draconibacterium sp.]|uniref:helix-turn-helix transcriptional regulator n=1 Tax=uncultured Draconibacterium sp. TaxID=1573823 RepID=UPI0025D2282C|nr:helix-turn-helix domain-containing protein [uncultured Draconibacterium sp.]
MNSISDKIIQGRKAKRINQKDFAQLIGVSQPSLIKFEKGETDLIPLGVAKKISNELDIPFTELFDIESLNNRRTILLEKIDELEEKSIKLKSEINDKELLIDFFKEKYKNLYVKKIERDFTDYIELLNEIYEGIRNFDSDEMKDKLKEQLVLEKEYMKDTIKGILKEGIFTDFELLELLYLNDIYLTAIVESENNIAAKLTEYWSEFMDISQSKVEQFLFWHDKREEERTQKHKAQLQRLKQDNDLNKNN